MNHIAPLLLGLCLLGAAHPSFIPKDASESARCVGGLGDVYWNPAKLPFGPTYGAYKGRPVFEEFMISQKEFAGGRNWQDIAVPARHAVAHMQSQRAPSRFCSTRQFLTH